MLERMSHRAPHDERSGAAQAARLGRAARGRAGDAIELPGEAQLRVAATGFALLADPSRLRILWVLAHGEADVSTLAQLTGVRATAVSQHLAKLRLAGLVRATRDGRRQVYCVPGGHVRRLVVEALDQAEHQIAGLPDHD